jgi:CO dehydrogenase nickel-insertion accessory protein CooC1
MNILIIGKSGYGKSNLTDVVKNAIFKADEDAVIHIDDPDRNDKALGGGSYEYNIGVRREVKQDEVDKADIVVEIKTKAFLERFREL